MKPIFELPVLQSLNGDAFSSMVKYPGPGPSCSVGCNAGCCSGCVYGSGSGAPKEQLSEM